MGKKKRNSPEMRRIKAYVRGRLLKAIGGFSRQLASHEYLKGEGLEIGALHRPLELPSCARVKHVDRLTVPELRKHYPELALCPLVNVDILDDGELLATVADGSLDFVVANHFLEHCENPVLALKNILRVLKNNGIAYLALPDKRFTFDKERAETGPEHFLKDYADGPEASRRAHFEEWVKKVEKVTDAEAARRRVSHLMNIGYSIHFHVFTQAGMLKFLLLAKEQAGLAFEVKLCMSVGHETIFILQKHTGGE
jgi:SAM-dependent methyltransferase